MSQTTNTTPKTNTKANQSQSQSECQSQTQPNIDPFANRTAQQIPNTPFVLYPAPNANNNSSNTNASSVNESDSKTTDNNNNNQNSKGIIGIDYAQSNANVMNNKNNVRLTNDLNEVLHEIDNLHNRIFHLRRTNKEIKEFYSDDVDCQIAYKENIDVINKNLKSLFVYFKLYTDLTKGQTHKIEKLYESDKKILEKYENMESKSVQYMMPQNNNNNSDNGNESKETNANDSKNTSNSNANGTGTAQDDNGMAIDDDGGMTI